ETTYPIDFYDTATLELLESMDTTQYGFSTFSLDQNGDRLIGTGFSGEIIVYDRRDDIFKIIREPGQFASLGGLRWSPINASIVGDIFGSSVDFLNIETGEFLGNIRSNVGRISDFAFHPNGNAIVTSAYVSANELNPVAYYGIEVWDHSPQSGEVMSIPSITLEDI